MGEEAEKDKECAGVIEMLSAQRMRRAEEAVECQSPRGEEGCIRRWRWRDIIVMLNLIVIIISVSRSVSVCVRDRETENEVAQLVRLPNGGQEVIGSSPYIPQWHLVN